MPRNAPTRARTTAPRAFSLIELLVVIAIIALLISILLPALAGARTAAKNTATQALLQDFKQAADRYKLDNGGTAPGYFTVEELGSVDNRDAGLTGNENALLSLLGDQNSVLGLVQDVDLADANLNASDVIEVGFGTGDDQKVYVDPSLLGTGGAYWTNLDPKYLVSLTDQASTGNDNKADPMSTLAFSGGMPEVIDSFGQPVLVWTRNEFGGRDMTTQGSYPNWRDRFVQGDDPEDDIDPLFYMNQNKGYLGEPALGGKVDDPTQNSAIGFDGGFTDEARDTFMAIYGNPAFPAVADPDRDARVFNPGNLGSSDIERIVPQRARGSFILHAAGKDGMWVAKTGKGFRANAFDPDRMLYGVTFGAQLGGSADPDADTDPLSSFDDTIVTSD